MRNKRVNSVFFVLFVVILSCGCCLTGTKKDATKDPYRGAVVGNSTTTQSPQPPIVKEAVPQTLIGTDGTTVPPGGVVGTSSNYPTDQPLGENYQSSNQGTCPTGTCPGNPSGQAITVAPSNPSGTPEALIQLPASDPGQSGQTPSTTVVPSGTSSVGTSSGTSTQVDKPVTPPTSNPSSSPASPSSEPKSPSAEPGRGPVTTGSFNYASQEPSQTGSDAYRQASDEHGVGESSAEKSVSDDASSKSSSEPAPSEKPKGKFVSLEKEVPSSGAAATPAKKDSGTDAAKKDSGTDTAKKDSGTDMAKKDSGTSPAKKDSGTDTAKKNSGADTDDPAVQDDLDTSSESGMEYSSEYPDGGDLTKSRPRGTYIEESTRPKYARGYTDLPTVNGVQQTIPFVSPGLYGESRTSIRIQAIP